MNALQVASRMAPRAVRSLSTSTRLASVSMKEPYDVGSDRGVVPASDGYRKFRELQNEFHSNPELMVWQKRGMRDSLPFMTTLVVGLGGLGLFFYQIYDMSFPKPPE